MEIFPCCRRRGDSVGVFMTSILRAYFETVPRSAMAGCASRSSINIGIGFRQTSAMGVSEADRREVE